MSPNGSLKFEKDGIGINLIKLTNLMMINDDDSEMKSGPCSPLVLLYSRARHQYNTYSVGRLSRSNACESRDGCWSLQLSREGCQDARWLHSTIAVATHGDFKCFSNFRSYLAPQLEAATTDIITEDIATLYRGYIWLATYIVITYSDS